MGDIIKQALVLGVANNASIASAIVEKLAAGGEYARIWAVYQGEKALPHVQYLGDLPNVKLVQCDVTKPEEVDALIDNVARRAGEVHFVHSIAFAPAKALAGPVHQVTADDFAVAMNVSVHSLMNIVAKIRGRAFCGHMSRVLTISYLGAERAMRGYGVMGVCKAALESAVRYLAQELGPTCTVNAVSPGPIKTRAAGGIPQFSSILGGAVNGTPGLMADTVDVANTAAFLLSGGVAAITGQTIYVDGGFGING